METIRHPATIGDVMKRPKPVSTSTPEAGRRPMRLDNAKKLPPGVTADLEVPTSPGPPAILVAPADLGAALVTNRLKGWQFYLEHVILGSVTDSIDFLPDPSPVSSLEICSARLSFIPTFLILIRVDPL
jgi:hypothetical protein